MEGKNEARRGEKKREEARTADKRREHGNIQRPQIRREQVSSWIAIAIVYDDYPEETSWELKMIGSSNYLALMTYNETNTDATLYKESKCLQEGEYDFVIHDSAADGISWGGGHYNITSPNGDLIAEGGEFEYNETTRFLLPFVPSPSAVPSISPSMLPTLSPHPSTSPSVSVAPSTSSFPTQTCFWVNISIIYDSYPEETSWELKINQTERDYLVLKSYSAADGDTVYTDSVCL